MIEAIIGLVATAVEHVPQLENDLREIFTKPNPTPADWQALRAKVLAKSYEDYVPDSAIAK